MTRCSSQHSTDALAVMPSASDHTTTLVKPGDLPNWRRANLKSWITLLGASKWGARWSGSDEPVGLEERSPAKQSPFHLAVPNRLQRAPMPSAPIGFISLHRARDRRFPEVGMGSSFSANGSACSGDDTGPVGDRTSSDRRWREGAVERVLESRCGKRFCQCASKTQAFWKSKYVLI